MIIKGKSVAGAKRLAVHLARTDTNERMEVLETRGVISNDLLGALKELEAVSSIARNCERPFYHASINTPTHERMTPEQRDIAIERLAKSLGLEHQPRVVVAHVKEDREHFHIVFSRVDSESFRVISDSHNYRTHEQVARQLEREFGHERVQGAHIERDGVSRPERTPSYKQLQQAERTKIALADAKTHVRELWQTSDDGKGFQEALQQSGWTLAKGDRRNFVVIDPQGGVHSLSRLTGVKAQSVAEFLGDIDREGLPAPDMVRQAQREKSVEQEAEEKAKARTGRAASSQEQRDQRQALRDAVALSGSQKMVNVEAVQMQRMRRRAGQADAEHTTNEQAKTQAAALAKRRALREQGEATPVKETTDRRQVREDKARQQPEQISTAKKQKGKGDSEQER